MPQITQLDNDPTPNNNDLLVTVDIGAGTTKNISRQQFFTGAPLPANTVDTQAIANNAVTSGKIANGAVTAGKLSSTSGVSLLVDRTYSTGNTNTAGANSFQTISGASLSFTAASGQLYLITASGGTVTNGTGTGTNVVLSLAKGTTALRNISFSAPAGVKGVCPTIRYYTDSLSGATTINLRGASATATNVQWDGVGGGFCLTVEKVLSA